MTARPRAYADPTPASLDAGDGRDEGGPGSMGHSPVAWGRRACHPMLARRLEREALEAPHRGNAARIVGGIVLGLLTLDRDVYDGSQALSA